MKKKGFTIAELLAVIVIIGILAVIAVPAVTNIMESINTKRNQEFINSAKTAAILYFQDEEINLSENEESCIKISVLIGAGYISNKDSENSENIRICVKYKDKKYEARQE